MAIVSHKGCVRSNVPNLCGASCGSQVDNHVEHSHKPTTRPPSGSITGHKEVGAVPQLGAQVLASLADPYAFLSFTLSVLIAE